MKADITWIRGMQFVGKSDSNRGIVIEVPEEGHEDERLGPGPMELMLMGIGACTASDVVWIMNKSRVKLNRLEIHLEAERAPKDPKKFTRIHMEYVLGGEGLKDKMANRAIQLSHEKYCSAASSVVSGGTTVTASHRIVQ